LTEKDWRDYSETFTEEAVFSLVSSLPLFPPSSEIEAGREGSREVRPLQHFTHSFYDSPFPPFLSLSPFSASTLSKGTAGRRHANVGGLISASSSFPSFFSHLGRMR